MLDAFLSTLARLPRSFPKSCLEQLLCRGPLSDCSSKKEFCSKRYLRPQFLDLKFTNKELHYRTLPGIFLNISSKIFKKFRQEFVFSNVTVDCQLARPNKKEFLEISRRATFRNISMEIIEFSKELQSAEVSHVS